jgi:hypothetical protein
MKWDQLVVVIERANKIIRDLSIKYAKHKGYLVFSSPYGQCEVTSDVKHILSEFPKMIIDSIDKEKALELIKTKELLKDGGKEKDSENKAVNRILDNLEFRNDTFIEIRFKELNYDTIFEMQKDPLVSQKHTPQTKASIRIVLGTLEELLISGSR